MPHGAISAFDCWDRHKASKNRKQLSMQIYFKTPPTRQYHPNTARASFLKSYTQKTLNSLNALRRRKKKKKKTLQIREVHANMGKTCNGLPWARGIWQGQAELRTAINLLWRWDHLRMHWSLTVAWLMFPISNTCSLISPQRLEKAQIVEDDRSAL